MNKPKICFVSEHISKLLLKNYFSNFMGGAELQQILIGKELTKRGYHVTYITMQPDTNIKLNNFNTFNVITTFKPNEGIPIIRFIYPRMFKLWKALRKSNSDIFYIRGAGYVLALVVLYTKIFNKIVIFVGANDPNFDPSKLILPVNFRDKLLYFWGLKNCDQIIVQNIKQKELLYRYFKRDGIIIHNGYDRLKENMLSPKNILWAGMFKSFKNPEIFLKLAAKFPKEKFIMIGGKKNDKVNNNTNLFDFIKEKSNHINNLSFKGFLALKEVEKHFEQTKIFINTSEHEGFPNTFLQAWSRGIPVVSFVDPDDLIKNNQLGFVVKDFNEMVNKVKEILDGNFKVPSKDIKTFFQDNLTIEKVVTKYEKIFHGLY